jgi:putative nucleotidyltransferase with HDIG domain
MTDTQTLETIRQRIRELESIPMVPAILRPLLAQLNRPPEQVQLEVLVQLVGCENSLTAKCLQMANSAIFGRSTPVTSIRGAVIALGVQRLRAILLSACMVDMFRSRAGDMDATVLWEHCFACALVSQQFARKIHYHDPEKAYLSGLLHDIGLILELVIYPKELQNVFELSRSKALPIQEAEQATLGFNHCEIGAIVAEEWHLPAHVAEVIRFHHSKEFAEHQDVVAMVHLCDTLCQLGGLGFGFPLMVQVDFVDDPAWQVVLKSRPELGKLDLARFTFELETYFEEVKKTVALLFRA